MPSLFSHAPAAEQTNENPDTGAVPTPVFSRSSENSDTETTPSRTTRR